MMREILFRAKTEDTGEWVYGYYYTDVDAVGIAHFILSPKRDPDGSSHRYDVNPDTVGQYIGFTEKNGKKVFEGDVVKYKDEVFKVTYSEEQARFLAKRPNGVFNSVVLKYGEVIGNRFDNPELFEEEDENGNAK